MIPSRPTLRFQPLIIRLYKLAGMVALAAILIGLIAFVSVNTFYFFNRTWVRPVMLSPSHAKVVAATTELSDAKLRGSELDSQRVDLKSQLSEIDRTVITDDKFLADTLAFADQPPKTEQAATLRRQIDLTALERANIVERKASIQQRLAMIDTRITDQAKIIERLENSPYIQATAHNVTIAFVPYQNLHNVTPGTTLYSCSWGIVICQSVGKVTAIIDGEVQDTHPHDDSIQRGVMIDIELRDPTAAEHGVLFAGSKPLWFL